MSQLQHGLTGWARLGCSRAGTELCIAPSVQLREDARRVHVTREGGLEQHEQHAAVSLQCCCRHTRGFILSAPGSMMLTSPLNVWWFLSTHKQLPFVVLAAWVILLRLTFYSLARLLARSFSPPPSSPSPCPSVHCGAPLPCVVTAVSGWCLAALGGSQLCAWSPGAVQSVSGCLSLSLVG